MTNKVLFTFIQLLAFGFTLLQLPSCCWPDDTEQGIYYKDRDKVSIFNLKKDSVAQYSSYTEDTTYYPIFNDVCDTALFEDYQLLVDFDDTYNYDTSQCQAFSFSFFPKAMATTCDDDYRSIIIYNNTYPIQYVDSLWIESLINYNADYSANSDITPAVSFLMYSGYYYGSRDFNNQEVNYDSLLYFLNEGYEGFYLKLDELPDSEKDVQFVVHVSLDTDTVLLDTTKRIYLKLD